MEEIDPLKIESIDEIDRLKKKQLTKLMDECEFIIKADYENITDEEFEIIAKYLGRIRKKIGSKAKLKAIRQNAWSNIQSLLYDRKGTSFTQEDYDKAMDSAIEAIKCGFGYVVEYFELIETIPGRELEWAAIKCLPEILTPESEHIRFAEKTLQRTLSQEELNKALRFSKELVASYKVNDGVMMV